MVLNRSGSSKFTWMVLLMALKYLKFLKALKAKRKIYWFKQGYRNALDAQGQPWMAHLVVYNNVYFIMKEKKYCQ